MNATPSSLLPTSRIWLLALTLAACGIETKPNLHSGLGGAGADAGTGEDGGAGKSGSGGDGRAGSNAGSGGKSGSGGSGTAGGAAGTTEEAGSGGSAGDAAGTGGEAGSAGTEPVCDESKSPKDEPCLIADEYAVFVAPAPTGVSGAAGTMAAPLPTVSAGIAAAVANEVPRVIVCAGTYEETVEITAGIQVYGGFDCGDDPWEPSSAAVTLVQPSAKGEALRIVDVEDAVVIEGIEFESMDGDEAGESSVAALVKGSAAVTLRGVKITAGDGVDGADGTTEAFTEWPKTGRPDDECVVGMGCLAGKLADGSNGGGDRPFDCPGGDMTVGGLGGRNVPEPDSQAGKSGIPAYGNGKGIGGPGGDMCQSGGDGADGPARTPGPGAVAHGSIQDGRWKAQPGTAGLAGLVGQGGGGGGGKTGPSGGGGGGGGGGGCGGRGGAPGLGGGASIALLALSSNVLVEGATLLTKAAGNGGAGAAGQDGMRYGGVPGSGSMGGCPGGAGGKGGKGGAGGGGAGGISVGIVWTGTEPVFEEDTSISFGTEGAPGIGGDAAYTSDDGVPGIADDVLEV